MRARLSLFGRTLAWMAFAASGCGRIGVELLELANESGNTDSGTPSTDADVPPSDAGSDAGSDVPPTDAGDDAAIADAGDDAAVDAGPQPCDFSGTWATKVEFPVSWDANVGISSGSDTAHVWVRHQSNPDGSVVPNSMVACGVTLPAVSMTVAAGGGTGRVSFDIPLFDNAPPPTATMPILMVHGEGFPGDATSLEPTASVIGATMVDPLGGAWPDGMVAQDTDGDGKPGVTLPHLNGNVDGVNYVHLPTAPFATSRAQAGFYASRVVLSANGTVLSCSEIAGTAEISHFNSRVLGCVRASTGADCSSTEYGLLEQYRPDHTPGAATYRAIKVTENMSCSEVRTTLP